MSGREAGGVLIAKFDKKWPGPDTGFCMNVSLGKLAEWVQDQVKSGDFSTNSEVVREAVRRMKDGQPVEPETLQQAMDQAEASGFRKMSSKDWQQLRRLAAQGVRK